MLGPTIGCEFPHFLEVNTWNLPPKLNQNDIWDSNPTASDAEGYAECDGFVIQNFRRSFSSISVSAEVILEFLL